MKNERKSFLMYKSYKDMLLRLDMEQRGRLITAVYEYVFEGKVVTELSAVADMAFYAMKETFDRDSESYAEKCRINTINGQKGGRPRKYETAYHTTENFSSPKTERFFEKPKKADNDNGNDNDNDNDNDNGNGNGNENENVNANGGVNDNENGDVYGNGGEKDNKNTTISTQSGELEKQGYTSPNRDTYDISAGIPPHPGEIISNTLFKEETGALSGEEITLLESRDVPIKYAEERLERAAYYAKIQKKSRCDLLTEWWKDDAKIKKNLYTAPSGERTGSFDTDEFFNLALQRSFG